MQESQAGRPRPGERLLRRWRRWGYRPIHLLIPRPRVTSQRAAPLVLIYSFAFLVAAGTALLLLPVSNTQGEVTPFLHALFTATSAVTVTGLVVVNTGAYWSVVGQAFILGLVFLGGLGFLIGATFLLTLVGRRITLSNRLLLRDALGQLHPGGVVRLARRIVFIAVAIQLLGAGLLWLRLSADLDGGQRAWQALFHSVSAFNNAGFAILPDSASLSRFRGDTVLLLTMAALIVLGGISYAVLADLFEVRRREGFPMPRGIALLRAIRLRRFSRLTLDTKVVLTLSLALWFLGTMITFAAEYGNADTLGGLPVDAKLLDSFFQSVSLRSAGFATMDYGGVRDMTLFFSLALMFIGGVSASTAGGIKVNTLGVLLWAVWSSLRGRSHVVAFGREIPEGQLHRALVVLVTAVFLVFGLALALTLTEGFTFLPTLFETVSAFGTVGFSTGITGDLSAGGQLVISLTMFVGRLGPLTVALSLALREETAHYRYPEERVRIG